MTTRSKGDPARAPTPKHRSSGRRLSHEQQQEYVSLDQCSARLSTYGWIRNELKRDHGEDVLIHIYEDGNSTGLTFLLQCKSTTDLASLTLKRDPDTLSYDFEVADLVHWSISTSPVVAMLWDVRQQEGRWLLVADAIRQLDARSNRWRHRASAAVHIPASNGTDDRGLTRLRRSVADHYLPLVARQHQTITIKPIFLFPHTTEGKTARAAFQAFLDAGEPVTIDGKFVKQLGMPDWWERLYGRASELQTVSMVPASANTSIPCRFEIDAAGFAEPIAIPYLDLRIVRGGRKEVVLSNEHQQIPTHITIATRWHEENNTATHSFTFNIEHAPANAYEARDATAFALALHTGQRIRLLNCADGKAILAIPFPRLNKFAFTQDILRNWHELLEKLCWIQARITRFGTVILRKNWLRAKDEAAIRRFYTICTTGEERATGTLSWVADPATMSLEHILEAIAACERDPSDPSHGVPIFLPPGESLRIANVTVPLGRIQVRLIDNIPLLRRLADMARSRTATTKIEYKDAAVVRRYLDWLPGGDYMVPAP